MTDLKDLLDGVAQQAKLYDVTERAVLGGRRRRRIRQAAGAGGVSTLVVVLVVGLVAVNNGLRRQLAPPPTSSLSPTASPVPSPSASPGPTMPTSCVAQRLPVPKGHPVKSVVAGGDPTGRFVVGRSYPDSGKDRVLIWDNGNVRTIAMPGADAILQDITSTGIAVGTSFVTIGGAEQQVAWIYRDGSLSRLKGVGANALAINENSVIVGTVNDKPVVWRSPSADPEFLPVPAGGWRGAARGVDEDGTIVGSLWRPATTITRAYAWLPDGTAKELMPAVTVEGNPANSAGAYSIRNGWISGDAAVDSEQSQIIEPIRWNLRTGEVRAFLPELGYSSVVNQHGWLVGEGQKGLVLVSEQGVVVLPAIDGQDKRNQHVLSVSDDGRVIAGYVGITEITPVAVMWRCN